MTSTSTATIVTQVREALVALILQKAQIAVIGAEKAILMTMRKAIVTCSTSFVHLVTKEAVENLLSSSREKVETFSLIALRRFVMKEAVMALAKTATAALEAAEPKALSNMSPPSFQIEAVEASRIKAMVDKVASSRRPLEDAKS